VIRRTIRVDRLRGATYLALTAAGCGGAPGPVVPSGAQPAALAEAEAWVARTRAPQPTTLRFRWLFRDQDGSAGGPGSARMTPTDSLRFDIAGPLGSGRGAAFVIGDSARWAQPEEDISKLVPNYPLLWAMLGVARLPVPPGAVTRYQDERLTAYRFVSGADTVEYAWFPGPAPRLVADVRRADGRLGRVETVFGPDGAPASSRLDVPRPPARLTITYTRMTRSDAFPPDTWIPPAP
jgi:hypothetical protein